MAYSDSATSETEPPVDFANMPPRVIERRPRDIRSNAVVEYQTYASERIERSSRATPQNPPPPVSTKMVVVCGH